MEFCCGTRDSGGKEEEFWEREREKRMGERHRTSGSLEMFYDNRFEQQFLLNKTLLKKKSELENKLRQLEMEKENRELVVIDVERDRKHTDSESDSGGTDSNQEESNHEAGENPVDDENNYETNNTESEKEIPNKNPEETFTEQVESFNECMDMGIEQYKSKRYPQARFLFIKAREFAIKDGNEKGQARAEGNLSNVYTSVGQPKRALVHFRRSLTILRRLKETALESSILTNGIICCIQIGEHDQALGLALRKLAISTDPNEKTIAEDLIDKINSAINNEISLTFNFN